MKQALARLAQRSAWEIQLKNENEEKEEEKVHLQNYLTQLVSWCFEPSWPLRITSGLKTNFNPPLSYSAHTLSYKLHHVKKNPLEVRAEKKKNKKKTTTSIYLFITLHTHHHYKLHHVQNLQCATLRRVVVIYISLSSYSVVASLSDLRNPSTPW